MKTRRAPPRRPPATSSRRHTLKQVYYARALELIHEVVERAHRHPSDPERILETISMIICNTDELVDSLKEVGDGT